MKSLPERIMEYAEVASRGYTGMTRVPVPRRMLCWARERTGCDVAHLPARIPQLPARVGHEW